MNKKKIYGCCAALAALLLAHAAPAWAYHTDEERPLDDAPGVLRSDEFRLGIWRLEYGLPFTGNRVQVGTYTLPWVGWAAGVHLFNAQAKVQLLKQAGWAASLGSGLVYLNMGNLDQTVTASFSVVPNELHIGYDITDKITVGVGALYTYIHVGGMYDPNQDSLLRGAVANSNLQMQARLDWRFSRVIALILQARFLGYEDAGGWAYAKARVDDYTTVETAVRGNSSSVLDPLTTFSVAGALAFSWSAFNLELGAIWGNWNLPVVNFLVPVKSWWPQFDMYWRF